MPPLQSLELPTQTLCLKQSDTKWLNSLCGCSMSLYTELGSKGAVEGIMTEQPRALGEPPPLLMFPRWRGLHLLNLCSVGNLADSDGDKPVRERGLCIFKDWPLVTDYLLISETHFITDWFYSSFSVLQLFCPKYFISSNHGFNWWK